jgi:hypothetical protein
MYNNTALLPILMATAAMVGTINKNWSHLSMVV